MHWILKVAGYGKIGKAEIEVAPLTLFVGDNNSGKSYLLSLLWGIQNLGIDTLLETSGTERDTRWYDCVKVQVDEALKNGTSVVPVCEIAEKLQNILNEHLQRNKNKIIKRIFNSDSITIEKMEIEFVDIDGIFLRIRKEEDDRKLEVFLEGRVERYYGLLFMKPMGEFLRGSAYWHLTKIVLGMFLDVKLNHSYKKDMDLYLPASRTGFMLTKDVINKVSRDLVFNLEPEQEGIVPFARTINQFLDIMNSLTLEHTNGETFDKIISYLEDEMAEGSIEMSALPNREVFYVPEGEKNSLPLRTVSAVVTELSPLILILKHTQDLHTLFYEEPEMCLHPQLQQKMARVICQLVNVQLCMMVTTHSDIILQHINNMIRLSKREDREEICQRFNYTSADWLDAQKVKVYQLKSEHGKTEVEELECGENGFAIPTFNLALDRMMDEAYVIQE